MSSKGRKRACFPLQTIVLCSFHFIKPSRNEYLKGFFKWAYLCDHLIVRRDLFSPGPQNASLSRSSQIKNYVLASAISFYNNINHSVGNDIPKFGANYAIVNKVIVGKNHDFCMNFSSL